MNIPPFSARRLQLAALFGPMLLPLLSPLPAVAAQDVAPAGGPVAGELVLSAGPVFLVTPEGERPLLRGQPLHAGSTLVTGEGGFAHIRMTDGGMVAIRPMSRFEIEVFDYQHDTDKDRVRYRLEQGVARSITGTVGERNKEAFRLNTPVAAVGVRGTDFVVSTNQVASRVALNSGAVVVAALGDTCQANGFGACTDASVLLGEGRSTADSYVEVLQGERVPRLVQDVAGMPDQISPPHTEEPLHGTALRQPAGGMRTDDAQSADGNPSVAVLTPPEPSVPEPIPTPTPEPGLPSVPTTPVRTDISDVYWGRWDSFKSIGPANAQMVASFGPQRLSIQVFNEAYGAGVREAMRDLPASGEIAFQPVSGEGMLVSATNVQALELKGGSLNVNFNDRTFSTTASFSNGYNNYITEGVGNISDSGYLRSDPSRSPATIYGVMGNGLDNAVTVIEQRVVDGNLLGVVGWGR